MAKLKVLPLSGSLALKEDSWYYPELMEEIRDTWKMVEPVFNRPGIYYMRAGEGNPQPRCWVELNGIAAEWDPKMFLWEIKTLEASLLMPQDIKGLQEICKTKLATPAQKELLYMWGHWMECLDLSRGYHHRWTWENRNKFPQI